MSQPFTFRQVSLIRAAEPWFLDSVDSTFERTKYSNNQFSISRSFNGSKPLFVKQGSVIENDSNVNALKFDSIYITFSLTNISVKQLYLMLIFLFSTFRTSGS